MLDGCALCSLYIWQSKLTPERNAKALLWLEVSGAIELTASTSNIREGENMTHCAREAETRCGTSGRPSTGVYLANRPQ